MTEDKQFETMGLQATPVTPTVNPLHRMPPYLKRKNESGLDGDDLLMSEVVETTSGGPDSPIQASITSPDGTKRLCVSFTPASPVPAAEDDKENKAVSPTVAKKSAPPPLVAPQSPVFASKSSSASSTGSSSASSSEGDENDDSGIKDINEDDYMAEGEDGQASEDSEDDDVIKPQPEENPKVIVQHQPLPSIYELQQHDNTVTMTATRNTSDVPPSTAAAAAPAAANDSSTFDSGLSEDSDVTDDDEDEEEDDDVITASPLFDQVLRPGSAKAGAVATPVTPKVIYNDRFWNQGSFGAQNTPQPPAVASRHQQQQQAAASTSFQFLHESGNRIECAENGKSYLQLGTIAPPPTPPPPPPPQVATPPPHHAPPHLPVTPILQPKSSNMVYARRPIPPFRGQQGGIQPGMIHLQQARPVCDHSNCLQRKSSFCYKNQRSRMLNLSLHKLHVARQNHDQDLRRSVLICNMLRYIEDEIEKDAFQESHTHFVASAAAAAAAAAATPPPPPPPTTPLPSQLTPQLQQQQSAQQQPSDSADHYWPPSSTVTTTDNNYSSTSYMSTTTTTSPMLTSTSTSDTSTTSGPVLKDFNSAFRSASYSGEPVTSDVTTDGLSLTTLTSTTTTTGDHDRTGINWGSVLSLGSSSELDPLNNNSFNTDGGWATTTTSTASSSPSSSSAVTLTELEVLPPGQTFDDISWKLAGSDDVLGSLKTSAGTADTEVNTFVR